MDVQRDWISILAIILGPILAVQASEWLQRRREARSRKVSIFKTLMATRASGLNYNHVEALNLIEVEFNEEKEVKAAWKAYLDHLNEKNLSNENWASKKNDLFLDMLFLMGKKLGYDFDRTDIKNLAYFPIGHSDFEQDQFAIRKGLMEIVARKNPLPVTIVSDPKTMTIDEPVPKA